MELSISHAKKLRWQVQLSDNKTYTEGIGVFKEIPGEKSPWQRLVHYVSFHKLRITSLSLLADEIQQIHLPSLSNRPRFKQFNDVIQPKNFNFYRALALEEYAKQENFTIIEAIYDDQIVQVWVNDETLHVWPLIKKLP